MTLHEAELVYKQLERRVRHPWLEALRHPIQFLERKINSALME